jgi:hypothetical protein
MYDPVRVLRVTADSVAASNGLVTNSVIALIHKVVVTGDGSNVVSANIHDDTNASNAALIKISVSANEEFATEFDRFVQADFNPPVQFNTGVSIDVTGNTAVAYVYYTKT